METKEIIKSIRICSSTGSCEGCIYDDDSHCGCSERLLLITANRLEKLESEKENLIHYNAHLNNQLNKAESHIEKLKEQLSEQQPEWISVEERLPEENGTYLIAVKGSHVSHFAGFDIEPNEFCDNVFRKTDVTHWMSLPEPPKPKEPTFKDVFLKAFPQAVVLEHSGVPKVCAKEVFPQLGDDESPCDMRCTVCWNRPYFEEEEEGGEE
jgi:hypothetical protein